MEGDGKSDTLIESLPKAELHVHLEGTLEPESMLTFAERNRISIPYDDVDDIRRAYEFEDLSSFLDVYYAGMSVLATEQDFYDLTWSYLTRAAMENIVHVEPFFDPQAHLSRGVPFGVVLAGILLALQDAEADFGITYRLIMCFLRDQPADEALHVLETARLYGHRISGVGLDSAEAGFPPGPFASVFAQAASLGLHRVAHAGEEGPASYITDALDLLGAERIDHGVRCLEDPVLVDRLVREQVPLTVCPLSNVKLRVFDSLAEHPLRRMLEAGLLVTVNSDDPAYFGGYLCENYRAMHASGGLTREDVITLAKNSFRASFLPDEEKLAHIQHVEEVAAAQR